MTSNAAKPRFGYWSDCENFFEIGAWSGLLTIAMFIGIALFATSLLYNIVTVDRFENPKGKAAVMGYGRLI